MHPFFHPTQQSGETSRVPLSTSSSIGQTLKQVAVPLTIAASVASILVPKSFADDAAPAATPVAPEKVGLGPPPSDWGLKQVYYDDCQKV